MAFDGKQIQVPTQRSGASSILRFVILLFDTLTIILLSVTLGLCHGRSELADYDNSDWADGLVLGVVFVSLAWTSVVSVRPAFTTALLHPGHYVAWELVCWLFISGCTVPALLLSTLLGIADVMDSYDECSNAWFYAGPSCDQKIISLQRLQVAAFSFALLLSILHFVLFIIACCTCNRYNKDKKTMYQIDTNPEPDPSEKPGVEV